MAGNLSSVAQYNLVFEQGTTYSLVLTWNAPNGAPMDLTGYSAKIHVVSSFQNQQSLLEFNSAGGGTAGTTLTLGGVAGTITVGATNAATTAMVFSSGQYGLLVMSAGGVVTKLIEGNVNVVQGVSW